MSRTAVIAGVGPGLGAALVRKLAREGCQVGMLARSPAFIESLANELSDSGQTTCAIPCDLTVPDQVTTSIQQVRDKFGPIDTLIYHAGGAGWNSILDMHPEEFEQGWRVCAYGAFLSVQAILPDMLQRGSGVILFSGATSSIRGRGNAAAFSSAKFAVRGLADSLARELWPRGIHVAHVIIDGVIDTSVSPSESPNATEPTLQPDHMADAYWNLIQQQKSAWTFEIDLRPFKEEFFT